MSREEADLGAAIRAGAQGYLLKDIEPEDLVPALEAVLAGDSVVAQELVGTMAELLRRDDAAGEARRPAAPFAELTPREREILECLGGGYSNKMIARALDISEGTVKLHVKAILRKLGIRSRVEAAVLAAEQGLKGREEGGAVSGRGGRARHAAAVLTCAPALPCSRIRYCAAARNPSGPAT